MDVITHYDLLIDENDDPFRDPPILQEYMNKWDGQIFIDSLELEKKKTALEIGVGTGRLAIKVAPYCKWLTGIDISPKTIERAKENLKNCANISLICNDFNTYEFNETFDIIYSSLTMMHLKNKEHLISKINKLLNINGICCLSIDKNQDKFIDMSSRKLEIFPDTTDNIISLLSTYNMNIIRVIEIENAHIIVGKK